VYASLSGNPRKKISSLPYGAGKKGFLEEVTYKKREGIFQKREGEVL
jgi:hypothetical protein